MPEPEARAALVDPEVEDEPTDDPAPSTGRGVGVLMVAAGALGLLAAMVLTIACGPVMQSRAGALFGFPNPLLGIIGFSVVLTAGVLRTSGVALPRFFHRGLQVGVLLAAVFITWLQTQSLYVIGALCLWCMLVWAVTIPLAVAVTLDNAAHGRLGAGLERLGTRLRPYTVTVVAVWYLVVLTAIGLRFYREFALFWFGVAL